MAKMDRISAVAEFDKLVEDWELDLETDMEDPDTKSSMEVMKSVIVNAIMKGKASIKDEELSVNLRSDETVTFKVPTGATYMELDRAKVDHSMKKLYNFMGGMTGKPANFFSKMDGRDVKICQTITSLFMKG